MRSKLYQTHCQTLLCNINVKLNLNCRKNKQEQMVGTAAMIVKNVKIVEQLHI